MRRFAGSGFSSMLNPPMETSPRARRNEAGDDAHRGRLACAVRPEKSEHLAFFNGKGNSVYGGDATK